MIPDYIMDPYKDEEILKGFEKYLDAGPNEKYRMYMQVILFHIARAGYFDTPREHLAPHLITDIYENMKEHEEYEEYEICALYRDVIANIEYLLDSPLH